MTRTIIHDIEDAVTYFMMVAKDNAPTIGNIADQLDLAWADVMGAIDNAGEATLCYYRRIDGKPCAEWPVWNEGE